MKINAMAVLLVLAAFCLMTVGCAVLQAINQNDNRATQNTPTTAYVIVNGSIYEAVEVKGSVNYDPIIIPDAAPEVRVDNDTLVTALNAIRAFTGHGINPTSAHWDNLSIQSAWINISCYNHVSLTDQRGEYDYNPSSDAVEMVAYYNDTSNNINAEVTRCEAYRSALEFARAHYDGFSRSNMELTHTNIWDRYTASPGYDFQWTEVVNGAYTYNFVIVGIDPANGNMYNYIGDKYQPISVATTPKISRDSAYAIALGKYPNITVRESSSELHVIDKRTCGQLLAWVVKIEGIIPNPNHKTGPGFYIRSEVTIDAITGKILHADEAI